MKKNLNREFFEELPSVSNDLFEDFICRDWIPSTGSVLDFDLEDQLAILIKFMQESNLSNKNFYIRFLKNYRHLGVLKMAIGLFFNELAKVAPAPPEPAKTPFNFYSFTL